ncbi:hypothetical protein [Streptomyces sp. NPDC059533]|uniref:hypothetical protein n=1 Tax=Streptomyces sp. NPDC059533 TaxID=3346858 RepID=UPI0036C5548E
MTCLLLRLDERIDRHRVPLAKKSVARLRISMSSRRRRFSRRSSELGQLVAFQVLGLVAFVGLGQPQPDRGLGQVEVFDDLGHGPVTSQAHLHDLGLEIGRELPPGPRLLLRHVLHHGHPSPGTSPDLGCPPNRSNPNPPITHETYAHVMPDAPGRLRALMDSLFTRETELSLPLEFEAVVRAA